MIPTGKIGNMTFEGRNGGRVSPSSQFKTCCPECAMPRFCPYCKASNKAKGFRHDEGVLTRVTGTFKCGTVVTYEREGAKFHASWSSKCQ